MGRRVLITGSDGHLGRALRARFTELGDEVIGIDAPETKNAEWLMDLNEPIKNEGYRSYFKAYGPHVVICNAKVQRWEAHEFLASCARQSVINIASIYGVLGNDPTMYAGTEIEPTPAWYAAAKGALIALTRWQATNLAPVRANAVCPGGILRGHSDDFRTRYEAKVPLRRMATEDDVVNAVEFLADPVLAAYITGAVLMVDGGLSACA